MSTAIFFLGQGTVVSVPSALLLLLDVPGTEFLLDLVVLLVSEEALSPIDWRRPEGVGNSGFLDCGENSSKQPLFIPNFRQKTANGSTGRTSPGPWRSW